MDTNSRKARRCPECPVLFDPVATRQLFCSSKCKADFHNRQTVRGRQLVPLVMADRIGRGGDRRCKDADIAISARQDSRMLMDRWAADDRNAGRMSMLEFMKLRRANGYEVLL